MQMFSVYLTSKHKNGFVYLENICGLSLSCLALISEFRMNYDEEQERKKKLDYVTFSCCLQFHVQLTSCSSVLSSEGAVPPNELNLSLTLVILPKNFNSQSLSLSTNSIKKLLNF